MILRRFEDIKAWEASRELVREIYRVSLDSSFARDYNLKDQIQRAAVSAMSNIAEGFERGTDKEFIRFLIIARSSIAEVRSQLYVAHDLKYIDKNQFESLSTKASEVGKLVNGFIGYLRNNPVPRKTRRPTDELAN